MVAKGLIASVLVAISKEKTPREAGIGCILDQRAYLNGNLRFWFNLRSVTEDFYRILFFFAMGSLFTPDGFFTTHSKRYISRIISHLRYKYFQLINLLIILLKIIHAVDWICQKMDTPNPMPQYIECQARG